MTADRILKVIENIGGATGLDIAVDWTTLEMEILLGE